MSNDPRLNPSSVQQAPGYPPAVAPKSNSKLIIIIVLIVLAVMALPCCGILGGLLLPAITAAKEASARVTCDNQIRQLGVALLNYEFAYGSLPPAYTVDAQGNRLHSWRTFILPFMEQHALYQQIDLKKPWDDPVNAAARGTLVEGYSCPSAPGQANATAYVVITGAETAFAGEKPTALREVSDGMSNTLLVTELPVSDQSIHWMEPRDLTLDEFLDLVADAQRDSNHFGGFHVIFGDGRSDFILRTTDRDRLRAMITRNGGEVIE